MKSKTIYGAIAVLLSVFCFSCEEIEEDDYPVSAKIDGVVYESKGSLWLPTSIANFKIHLFQDSLHLELKRQLFHADSCLTLSARVSSDAALKLNHKYPVVCNRTHLYHHVKYYEAISGWLMIRDTTSSKAFYSLRVSGEFEIVFDGLNDEEDIILTEGRFGPMEFDYNKKTNQL